MKKNLICIACPMGCHLLAEEVDGAIQVSGNKCQRGNTYAFNELTNPKRMVTSVVKCDSPEIPFAPVRTSDALEMKLINRLLEKLRALKIVPPICRGEVIISNFEGSEVNIIATRSVEK